MKPEDVRKMVQEVAEYAGDNEAAHGAEDRLYIAVLEAIAGGAKNPRQLAAEALETRKIDFDRWCS